MRGEKPKRFVKFKSKLGLLGTILAVVLIYRGAVSTRKATAVSVSRPPVTKAQSVCLDPGHGGVDPGAVYDGLQEKDLNLQAALLVRQQLETQGYRVFMTRTNDVTHTNHDRYTFCNARQATIMVAIHQNYFDDPTADYASALYFKPQDTALAQALVDSTSSQLNLANEGVSSFEDGVLSESNMPAALVEGLFMTDDHEATLLNRSANRLQQEATGITQGIVSYFNSHPAGQN